MGELKQFGVEQASMLNHLIERRCEAAKVYPMNGKWDRNYLERVQGFKLTKGEMQALKRG
ncbi:hypothetical protein [Phascolarctobacterium sp.]|uniref:hypothetical protein n=1 Tax=Phascolarctobacterium sp. TaxID=2049039 RepID=UPI00386FAD84